MNTELAQTLQDMAKAQTVCPRCEAKPGETCKTVPAGKSTSMHTSRWEPLAQAYFLYRVEGYGVDQINDVLTLTNVPAAKRKNILSRLEEATVRS